MKRGRQLDAERRRDVDCARTPQRERTPAPRAVGHLALHADAEPVQRRRQLLPEARITVEPRLVAHPEQTEVDVELALRGEQQRMHAGAVADRVEVGRDEALQVRPRLRARDQRPRRVRRCRPPPRSSGGLRARPAQSWHPAPRLQRVERREALRRRRRSQQRLRLVVAFQVLVLGVGVGHDRRRRPATLARPSRQTIVRIAIAVSRLPEKSK